MTSDITKIAVLESQWWKNDHTSIRGLFDLISYLTVGRPDGYHYETINSKVAAKDAIMRVGGMSGVGTLYIASHGNTGDLCFADHSSLSAKELVAALNKIQKAPQSRLTAVYLGACMIGSEATATRVLANNSIVWLAGYDKAVDFAASSALDMALLADLVSERTDMSRTELQIIKNVAERIQSRMTGLIKELGFHIWVRKQGRGAKGVRDLLDTQTLQPVFVDPNN